MFTFRNTCKRVKKGVCKSKKITKTIWEAHWKVRNWIRDHVNLRSDAIDDPNVSYSAAVMEADDSGSEQVPVDSSDMVGQQHVALVTQEDGTQQQVK